jgi:t-SNARE complex subunit (syntaxin)
LIKSYEKTTANTAIELTETQKEKMKGDWCFDEEGEVGMIEEEQNGRDSQINELVKTINKLSTIYKELNELVVKQGSIIDRIDENVLETFFQVEKGNEHLKGA